MSQFSTQSGLEKFPDFNPCIAITHQSPPRENMRRRRSSALKGDLRGDTGAPALSTLNPTPHFVSPPLTPRSAAAPTKSKRRKAKSLFRRWKNLSFTHTWVNPLAVILAIIGLYEMNPTRSNPFHKAIFLSHELHPKDPLIPHWARGSGETYFGKGKDDIAFVAFYTIVLSFTREFLMQVFIRPLALWYGITNKGKQSRFMEQVYTAIYFGIFGPLGLYVMSRTPVWYFNTDGMYQWFPHRAHDGLFKAYYLLQASYWAQQAIVLLLQLEKPRKDFKELVMHHVVTLALIGLSYRFHFTYMGLAVYITHDISDFFLASAKTLNYIDSPIQLPYFSFFIGVWIYLRHYINLKILWSILTTFKTVGPYDVNWETQQYKCWISQYITFGLLALLQSINLFWLYYILRIAYRAVAGSVVKDTRSDDEEEEETEVNGTSTAIEKPILEKRTNGHAH